LVINKEVNEYAKNINVFAIGATRTPEAKELLYSRQYFVTCAKAYRLQAIDLVYINFKVLRATEIYAQINLFFSVAFNLIFITFFIVGY
jgi:citrate lyase beta subunit